MSNKSEMFNLSSPDNCKRKSLDNYYYYAKLMAVHRLEVKRKEMISILEERLRNYQEAHTEALQLQNILNEIVKLSLETKALREANGHIDQEIEMGEKAISSASRILGYLEEKVSLPPEMAGQIREVLNECKHDEMAAGNEYATALKDLNEKWRGNTDEIREFVAKDVKDCLTQWSQRVQDTDSN